MKKLEKTAQAVREYDKVNKNLSFAMDYDYSNDAINRGFKLLSEALHKVGEAFYEDTKDVNCYDNCMLVTPDGSNGWLRKMLLKEGYKDCAPSQNDRKQRGWNW